MIQGPSSDSLSSLDSSEELSMAWRKADQQNRHKVLKAAETCFKETFNSRESRTKKTPVRIDAKRIHKKSPNLTLSQKFSLKLAVALSSLSKYFTLSRIKDAVNSSNG